MLDRITTIPEPTLRRLSTYYQYLCLQADKGVETISCTDISNTLNLTSIQVRKDLQYAGAIGKPKVGYDIVKLIRIIGNSLGYNNINEAFLVGVGNFGKLLLEYNGFSEYGFNIIAAFDNDVDKVNSIINGVRILNINKFDNLVRRMGVKIGIIAVDEKNAQYIADLMAQAGIEAIWNLTHSNIELPDNIIKEDVNLGASLSFLLSKIAKKYN